MDVTSLSDHRIKKDKLGFNTEFSSAIKAPIDLNIRISKRKWPYLKLN